MVHYLTKACHKGGYRFWVRFNNGEADEVDLEGFLTKAGGEMGKHFRENPDDVKDFYLDPWPTLAWKCGYDLAPETLYDLFVKQNSSKVAEKDSTYDLKDGKGTEPDNQ